MARAYLSGVVLLSLVAISPAARAAETWEQKAEKQPSAADAAPAPVSKGLADWIWGPKDDGEYRLTKRFQAAAGLKRAVVTASADNHLALSLNGKQLATSSNWQQPVAVDVTKELKAGDNELSAVVRNEGGPAGFSCRLVLTAADGGETVIASDGTWKAAPAGTPNEAVAIRTVAKAGEAPWGEALAGGAAPAGSQPFNLLPGFRVEKLFTVPQDVLGSWVCITTDPKGRLIASDQGDKGLVRITPAPLDGSKPTTVEKIPVALSGAQGLLWAFDALYVVCNGGPGSGLYRATDSDGDDVLDKVEKLRTFEGGGEHGPHSVRLSPDGKSLYVIAGNHTLPPFKVEQVTEPQSLGGLRTEQRRVKLPEEAKSRLPANWDEDLVIPRMWDAGGHAVGILAPGGWVAKTDRDGKTWEIHTAGYRNPYDFAFNADGEMFVYDADMEWDFGSPWYRPTRVNHATSGSELGWRSGAGKWPASYADSLPAAVDIGPGSPVGVTFGYGTKFPAKYQKALFICDWTFGTMYAIHVDPKDSTYSAEKEEFVSRTPLPLTDVTVGLDGAVYFTVGGRGGQSELYRVTYAGDEPTAPVDARTTKGAEARKARQALEAFHVAGADTAKAVAAALPKLADPDRFVRYAARIALEHQPLDAWAAKALAATDARARIQGAIAAARQAEPSMQPQVLAALDGVDLAKLDTATKIDLVRAYELAMIRLGELSPEAKAKLAARLGPLFPSGSFDLDRELASVLVTVRAPGIVSTLVGLMAEPSDGGKPTNLAPNEEELRQLITRNAGYGSAIRDSLEKRSDLLQVHFAYCLRTVTERDAWTVADRQAFHQWFTRARQWAGGASFRKFLVNMENESLAGLTDNDKLALEAQGALTRWVAPPLPKPVGPGKPWTVDEVLAAAEKKLASGRNFDAGQRTFAAARCVVCHRYGEDGGSTGPDLTQAGGRFQIKDLVEAMVVPSKVVSDQYKGSIVTTHDGKALTGRIVKESPEAIVIVTDPEDATKFVELSRKEIEEIVPASESLMPKALLDTLNEEEVLDLLAYTLARGNRNDARFKK